MNLILLLGLLFLNASLIVGLAFVVIGLYKGKSSLTKSGLLLTGVPIILLITGNILFNVFSKNKITAKPTIFDLVGTYHIGESSSRISENKYKSYKLELRNDSSFSLSPNPYIDLCENGRFEMDTKYSQLRFTCDKHSETAVIVGDDNRFEIEFIHGDPDEGESIHFERDK